MHEINKHTLKHPPHTRSTHTSEPFHFYKQQRVQPVAMKFQPYLLIFRKIQLKNANPKRALRPVSTA